MNLRGVRSPEGTLELLGLLGYDSGRARPYDLADVGWDGQGMRLRPGSASRGYGVLVAGAAELPRSFKTFGRRLVESFHDRPLAFIGVGEPGREWRRGTGCRRVTRQRADRATGVKSYVSVWAVASRVEVNLDLSPLEAQPYPVTHLERRAQLLPPRARSGDEDRPRHGAGTRREDRRARHGQRPAVARPRGEFALWRGPRVPGHRDAGVLGLPQSAQTGGRDLVLHRAPRVATRGPRPGVRGLGL